MWQASDKDSRWLGFMRPGAHAVLVLDGAGWHSSPPAARAGQHQPAPVPRYSPELNPVENVRTYLRRNPLSHRVWDSYDDHRPSAREAALSPAPDSVRAAPVNDIQ
jgi:hypothetical protein